MIVPEVWFAKDIRRKEGRGKKGTMTDMSMSRYIFKPVIKSVDVCQSGHLSSSHPALSASGC